MPIHLYWGDNSSAREGAVQELIDAVVEPAWQSMNLSRLDGSSIEQAAQALNEARTAPFGSGGRVVLLVKSPFCEHCSTDLAVQLVETLELIPGNTHLLLVSRSKPDARLKTTKALRKTAIEKSFPLPAIWDEKGQIELTKQTAKALGVKLEDSAAQILAETVGNDSSRLKNELNKLSIYCGNEPITSAAVDKLTGPAQRNALKIGEILLKGEAGSALNQIDELLANNEPALRLAASLSSQIRGLLWICLMEQQGEKDVNVIAKAAGIRNPKRIYIMRKQVKSLRHQALQNLLSTILKIESELKHGKEPRLAFRLLANSQII